MFYKIDSRPLVHLVQLFCKFLIIHIYSLTIKVCIGGAAKAALGIHTSSKHPPFFGTCFRKSNFHFVKTTLASTMSLQSENTDYSVCG